ncbi:MAG: hypothetical protein WC728_02515 [Elusimicrobiota bacterium]
MPATSRANLFLLGMLSLLLELILIRYLAGSVWNLGYFPNLVLMAAFIGMGAGFIVYRRFEAGTSELLFESAPWVLFGLALFVRTAKPNLGFGSWSGAVGGELYFTGGPAGGPADLAWLACWFLGVCAVFALISQKTAGLFARLDPLTAYTLDIGGSVCGILLFAGMSWLEWPAAAWLLVFAILFLLCSGKRLASLPLAGLILIALWQDSRALKVLWSPYQRVELSRPLGRPQRISVNNIPHQEMFRRQDLEGSFYQAPYKGKSIRSVLILGAGAGNDAAAALVNGVERVDAVEIDPVIARLGRELHPLKPYQDARVRLHVTDGRAFLKRAEGPYDLIVFGLTDSLVRFSPMSQLRLENYLFTREALGRAFSLLSDTGDIVLYNHYREDWLADKVRRLLEASTGRKAELLWEQRDFKGFRAGKSSPATTASADVPTDDWPFLYLKGRGIPFVYGMAMAFLALLAGLMPFLAGGSRHEPKLKLAFLLMGTAFLLLETKSIIQCSLLFGATWQNTALVSIAILSLILAANWTARVVRSKALLPASYALVVASSAAGLLCPTVGLLTFAPVYFANIIFSAALRDQEDAASLFGWNLLGATLGGALEYAGMAFGYRALGLVVLACYTGAVLLLYKRGPRT